jgi:hypothetical protein
MGHGLVTQLSIQIPILAVFQRTDGSVLLRADVADVFPIKR